MRKSVAELARVLKPSGKLYICSNGLGWYLYNIIAGPYPSPDFSPRRYGAKAVLDTLAYRLFGRPPANGGSVATGRSYLASLLEQQGIEVVASGPEASIRVSADAPEIRPFFRGSYYGLEGTLEWLGQRVEARQAT